MSSGWSDEGPQYVNQAPAVRLVRAPEVRREGWWIYPLHSVRISVGGVMTNHSDLIERLEADIKEARKVFIESCTFGELDLIKDLEDAITALQQPLPAEVEEAVNYVKSAYWGDKDVDIVGLLQRLSLENTRTNHINEKVNNDNARLQEERDAFEGSFNAAIKEIARLRKVVERLGDEHGFHGEEHFTSGDAQNEYRIEYARNSLEDNND